MILCDIDGVLAFGPTGDTAVDLPIYRSFVQVPPEFGRIVRDGIALHVVTAKVADEAAQVLHAVGARSLFSRVIGAEDLLFPTLRRAVWNRELPRALYKSTFRSRLRVGPSERVVMLEDNRWNLEEMLARGAIDFGLLVPPIVVRQALVQRWFDLDYALGVARELANGLQSNTSLAAAGINVESRERDPRSGSALGWLVHIPDALPRGTSEQSLPLEMLDTGSRLVSKSRNIVSMLRNAKRRLKG